MTSIVSSMRLSGLELNVFLGWPDQERVQTQTVSLDIHLNFQSPPQACITDNLDETFCYAQLTTVLEEKLIHKQFHLIEHLGAEIYQTLKTILVTDLSITVRVTKYPHIKNLTKGVSFIYGDEMIAW